MGTIVVLLLLGWLACTALLTIGIGGPRGPRMQSGTAVEHGTSGSGEQDVSSPAMAVGSSSEAPSTAGGVD